MIRRGQPRPERRQEPGFQPLPHSEESERAVLAAILLSPTLLPSLSARLKAGDFYFDKHQLIFQAMVDLAANGRPIDLRTIQACLEIRNQFELCGGLAYLTALDLFLPDIERVMTYAEVVKERMGRRRLMKISSDVTSACLGGGLEAHQILAEAQRDLAGLAGEVDPVKPPQKLGVGMAGYLADLRRRYEEQSDTAAIACGYGFDRVDRILVGLARKNLSLWVAEPGCGKTAWGLQMAMRAARAGCRVLFVSLEMSERELYQRLACQESGIPLSSLIKGHVSGRQLLALEDWGGAPTEEDPEWRSPLTALEFQVDDQTRGLSALDSRIRALAAGGWVPDVVFCDFMQKLQTGSEDSWLANAQACDVCRQLAKDLDLHWFMLSQANEKGKNRGGGAWQEADQQVLMKRPWLLKKDPSASPDDRARTLFEVVKNRLGPTEEIEMFFRGQWQLFAESYELEPVVEAQPKQSSIF